MKRTVVYSFLVYDIPHYGHCLHLEKARELGGILIVGVLDDVTVAGYKRKPVMNLEERMRLVGNFRGVDLVVPQFEKYPLNTLKALHRLFPDDRLVCVHGDDWSLESFGQIEEYLKSVDGELILLPYFNGQSTTKIVNEIARRYGKNGHD